eukprot:CAMPEP_0194271996 /NCGR_PEP_ID=MMETSP0169-20130528/5664_1 /TAXON_ID=218684 /ORGANISM="Corethron pennatum, Strain L29A3" /LENGTH=553 /DNA_ID=CAMNT_0039014529 /DNA_START=368 /DNA_END=2029 /DNA_ORIENTATION=-
MAALCACNDYNILSAGSFDRSGPDGAVSIKQLIRVIKEAVGENHGLSNEEYDELLKALNHQDMERHNHAVKSGLAKALYRLLDVILPNDDTGEQVGYLVTAFALLFQCGDDFKLVCYDQVGRQLIPLLLHTCEMCLYGKVVKEHSPELILATVTKILGIFCKLGETRRLMAGNENLLNGLVDIIDCKISADARVDAIWAVSILALDDENRLILSRHPDIIDALIEAAEIDHEMTKNEISAAILNISAVSEAHTPLARHPGFLRLVHRLLMTAGEPQVRAAGIIRNIASSEGARAELVSFDNGSVLAALCYAMIRSANETAAARAAGAVKNMSFTSDPAVQQAMLAHPEFLKSIGRASHSDSENVRSYASVALKNFAECCQHPMPSHPVYLDVLVEAAAGLPDAHDAHAEKISASFLIQASRPENVAPCVQHRGLPEALARLSARPEVESRANGTKSLEMLASTQATRVQLCSHPGVLDTVAAVVAEQDPRYAEACENAFALVHHLVMLERNRPRLAEHEGLLEAMLGCVRRTEDAALRKVRFQALSMLLPSLL